MPPSSEQPDDQNLASSLQQAADLHIGEILGRRTAAIASRAAAIANHPAPLTLRAQMVRAAVAGELAPAAEPVSTSQTNGFLLAIGDSWFDYPIRDVLTMLDDHFAYNVESAAHKGDAIENMVSRAGQLDKFTRNLDKIKNMGATPKAVLLSGGGNDIAGKHFDLFLNNTDLQIGVLNEQVVEGVIDTRLATTYKLMILKVNAICTARLGHTIPILIHGYDHPVPDGRGFLGGGGLLPGPWLKPGFDDKLYPNLADNIATMVTLIDRFNAMLQTIANADPNVHYIDLRGVLSNAENYQDFWANELHPTGGNPFDPGADGFLLVAKKFADVLGTL